MDHGGDDPAMNDPASGSTQPPAGSGEPVTAEPAAPTMPVTGGSATPTVPVTDYTNAGVPTLDYLHEKVEKRYATSLGSTELARDTAAGRTMAEQQAERARLAAEKLEEIRKSLHPDG